MQLPWRLLTERRKLAGSAGVLGEPQGRQRCPAGAALAGTDGGEALQRPRGTVTFSFLNFPLINHASVRMELCVGTVTQFPELLDL